MITVDDQNGFTLTQQLRWKDGVLQQYWYNTRASGTMAHALGEWRDVPKAPLDRAVVERLAAPSELPSKEFCAKALEGGDKYDTNADIYTPEQHAESRRNLDLQVRIRQLEEELRAALGVLALTEKADGSSWQARTHTVDETLRQESKKDRRELEEAQRAFENVKADREDLRATVKLLQEEIAKKGAALAHYASIAREAMTLLTQIGSADAPSLEWIGKSIALGRRWADNGVSEKVVADGDFSAIISHYRNEGKGG